ncbi:hypothetical protein IQ255_27140 [Pleurocapsales cyanobacterium LEGE 10410]|nr:hypothetical protein [Pleurocapsales cyanobacterium LEGE 10410]
MQILDRNEMRNIKGGSTDPAVETGDCQAGSCNTMSSYYNCLQGKCLEWYSGYDQITCSNTIQEAWGNMIEYCGPNYG